jgi:uroporphyrinogen-III synthase
VRALKEVGLTPTLIAATPTTEGVLATLKQEQLQDKTVGVQLYPEAPSTLADYLQGAGATVHCVSPYVYAPQSATQQVTALIHELADSKVDAIIFTSSPQVDRLIEVARASGLEQALEDGWSRTKVASIGPVVAETLRQHGIPVDICPEQGFVMKNLVQHVIRALAQGSR